MSPVRVVHVPPSLVRGRVRRLVETQDGVLFVQVWAEDGWQAEPSDLISHSEVQRGLSAPHPILRALGVPEVDWVATPRSSHSATTLLAMWALLEWLCSPASASLLIPA